MQTYSLAVVPPRPLRHSTDGPHVERGARGHSKQSAMKARAGCSVPTRRPRQSRTEAAFLTGFAPGRGGDALRVGEGARGAGESPCPPRRRMTAFDGSNGPVSRCGVPRDPARRPVAETSAPDAAGDSTASASAQTRPHCLSSSAGRGILGPAIEARIFCKGREGEGAATAARRRHGAARGRRNRWCATPCSTTPPHCQPVSAAKLPDLRRWT